MSLSLLDELSWFDQALCARAEAGATWFPEGLPGGGLTSETIAQIARAQSYCNVCPVRGACRDYALDNKIEHGIWGGETEGARREVLKQRRKAAR
jgi:WhiB family transcriptional regulator, redox-sensing transcriptional regulator